jgi:hypothetical protein
VIHRSEKLSGLAAYFEDERPISDEAQANLRLPRLL